MINKANNGYQTQPRNALGQFGSKGKSGFANMLKEYENSLSINEKNFVTQKKTGCVPTTHSAKINGVVQNVTFYEDPKRQNKTTDNNGYQKEVKIATYLALQGFDVYLIEESSSGNKKVDAIVNNVSIEFKKSDFDTTESIKNNYQKGMKKEYCNGIFLHFSNSFKFDVVNDIEGYTRKGRNGILTIWVESEDELYNFDMKKIRESHNKNSLKNIGGPPSSKINHSQQSPGSK